MWNRLLEIWRCIMGRKKKPVNPEPAPDNETPEQRAFRMHMAVVFKGDIYTRENKGKLPEESKEYLMDRSEEWVEE